MNILKKFSVIMLLLGAIFMTGCDASQIIDVISKVAEGVQKAIPAIKEVINTVSSAVSSTNKDTANNTATQNTTNTAQETDKKENDASVIVVNPTDAEEVSGQTTATSTSTVATSTQTSTTTATATETVTATQTSTVASSSAATQTQTSNGAPAISEKGQQQMADVVDYALRNNRGASNGECFNAVWGYLTSSGYGNLKAWGDLPNMGSDEAREFAEFMNKSGTNLDEAGLQRLDTAFNPPITSPHDPRIPAGAVIVVAAGSYGTAHPTAGDIVIKAGEGRFVNDGPNMDYGTASNWTGKLLGVYIPK